MHCWSVLCRVSLLSEEGPTGSGQNMAKFGAFEDYSLTNMSDVLVQCSPQEMGCLSTTILQTLT